MTHSGGQDTVVVNQQAGSAAWQLLGTYAFDSGPATVSVSDDANGYVIADAVMLAPPGAAPNTATWSVNVPSSGTWNVYARWTQHPNRASNAKFTVNHSGGATVVTVNQMAGGGTWSLLGAFALDAGTTSVSVTDQADGYVIADAVMIAPPGAGPNTATWTPNVAQAGQYEVYARWTASANRATDATYTVTHASGQTSVPANQQANGGLWNLLGTFTLNPGTTHNISLTDQANGYVIADAIRLVPVQVQAQPRMYFIEVDHLNTPRLVADDAGTAVWKWDQQEAFGDSVADENPSALGAFDLPLRLPGQYLDDETGVNYNYARYYDAGIGRYKESDPIGLRAGLNTYAYAGGRPLTYIDLLGLDATNWNNTTDGRSRWDGPTNGNWGGKCWSGGAYSCEGHPDGNAQPTDSADACYMAHDKCYESPTCNTPNKVENEKTTRACDLALVECLSKLPDDSRKWPNPPRKGTEGDSERYRNAARRYFQ